MKSAPLGKVQSQYHPRKKLLTLNKKIEKPGGRRVGREIEPTIDNNLSNLLEQTKRNNVFRTDERLNQQSTTT